MKPAPLLVPVCGGLAYAEIHALLLEYVGNDRHRVEAYSAGMLILSYEIPHLDVGEFRRTMREAYGVETMIRAYG